MIVTRDSKMTAIRLVSGCVFEIQPEAEVAIENGLVIVKTGDSLAMFPMGHITGFYYKEFDRYRAEEDDDERETTAG